MGEHFGIVPLEAMFCGTPVLAVNSGGPLETIDHGVTGWLEDGQPHAWSEVMRSIGTRGSGRLSAMGVAGRARVKKYFSFNAFASHLHDHPLCPLQPRQAARQASSSIPLRDGHDPPLLDGLLHPSTLLKDFHSVFGALSRNLCQKSL